MPWKKDLAKLKQELKNEDPPPAPKASPLRRVDKPEAPADLEGEDAVFLAAMGGRRAPKPSAQDKALPIPEPSAPSPAPVADKDRPAPSTARPASEPDESFAGAMAALKGMTRTVPRYAELEAKRPSSEAKAAVKSQPQVPVPAPAPILPPEPVSPASVSEPEPPSAPLPLAEEKSSKKPVQIQLAAGMAVDVDGSLDLRGHSSQDALDRLKERVLDGQALGWRTLHLFLGNDAGLVEAFDSFIKGPAAMGIARYAQAPIPMGGAQARILYFSGVVPGIKEGV